MLISCHWLEPLPYLYEEVQLPCGLVEVCDAGGAVGDGDVEHLFHAAVEPGDALQVERLRRLVDDGAVGDRIWGD